MSRPTPAEVRNPVPPDFANVASRWAREEADALLGLVWAGCDRLAADYFSRIPWDEPLEQLETTLNLWLYLSIQQCMTRYEAFDLVHAPTEQLTRAPAPAMAPTYDLAFRWRDQELVWWPIEGKVLPTDGRLNDYVKEVQKNYLTCRYAPLSGEGAMVGYLMKGEPEKVLARLGEVFVTCPHPTFAPARAHAVSDHDRSVPHGKPYAPRFRCHHLILLVPQP